jgi:hypothetical protein
MASDDDFEVVDRGEVDASEMVCNACGGGFPDGADIVQVEMDCPEQGNEFIHYHFEHLPMALREISERVAFDRRRREIAKLN